MMFSVFSNQAKQNSLNQAKDTFTISLVCKYHK